jgi:hypothetical protein
LASAKVSAWNSLPIKIKECKLLSFHWHVNTASSELTDTTCVSEMGNLSQMQMQQRSSDVLAKGP